MTLAGRQSIDMPPRPGRGSDRRIVPDCGGKAVATCQRQWALLILTDPGTMVAGRGDGEHRIGVHALFTTDTGMDACLATIGANRVVTPTDNVDGGSRLG